MRDDDRSILAAPSARPFISLLLFNVLLLPASLRLFCFCYHCLVPARHFVVSPLCQTNSGLLGYC